MFFCHRDGAHGQGELLDVKVIKNILEMYGEKITKIRLAGGEPLLHPEIFNIIEMCSNVTKDVGIVTNGILLEKYFSSIINSSLGKITISLHTYNVEKYVQITKINEDVFKKIINNIEKISKLKKVKLNAVILKNINTSAKELRQLLNFCVKNNLDIEFIEMDLGTLEHIDFEMYHISSEEVKCKIEKIFDVKMNYSDEKCNYTCKINNSKIEVHKSLCYNKLCHSCNKYRPIIVYPNGKMNRCRIGKGFIEDIDINL